MIDPFEYLYDSEYCYAERDGHLLYKDKNHFSNVVSHFLGKAYEKFIAPM